MHEGDGEVKLSLWSLSSLRLVGSIGWGGRCGSLVRVEPQRAQGTQRDAAVVAGGDYFVVGKGMSPSSRIAASVNFGMVKSSVARRARATPVSGADPDAISRSSIVKSSR